MSFPIEFFSFPALSVFISIFGYGWYLYSVITNKSIRPKKSTWYILSTISILIAFLYYKNGAIIDETLLIAVVNAFGATAISVALFFYGSKGWDYYDKIAVISVLSTTLFWLITTNNTLAYIMSLLIDFFALLPTIFSVMVNPKNEPYLPWFITVVGNVCAVASLNLTTWQNENWLIVSYPLYLLLINGLVFALIITPRHKGYFIRN